jgi:hypothetical protein
MADFTTIGSLHNKRYGGCLLYGARSGGDSHDVGSGRCAGSCRVSWAAPNGGAPSLPQHATDEEKGKCIAQAQSASWHTQS